MGNALTGLGVKKGDPPLHHAAPDPTVVRGRPRRHPHRRHPHAGHQSADGQGHRVPDRPGRRRGRHHRLRGSGQGRLGGRQPPVAPAQDRRRRGAERRLDPARPPPRPPVRPTPPEPTRPRRAIPCFCTSPAARCRTRRWSCIPRPATASATRSPPATGRTSGRATSPVALSDMGWAKAAWGKLFGQWQQGATVVLMNMGKPDPDQILDIIGPPPGHGVLRPAHAVPEPGSDRHRGPRPVRAAALRIGRRAAEPRGDPGLAGGDPGADRL